MEGKTYRYYKGPGDPIYPFGYGLSYTKFSYSQLYLNSSTLKEGDGLTVNVQVSNTGQYDSDEASQQYYHVSPIKQFFDLKVYIHYPPHLNMIQVLPAYASQFKCVEVW